jgi:TrmH family RNA methyltransferase
MPPALRITSEDNPRIKQLLHLRKNRDRRQAGVFIAEGEREIERALAAGLKIQQFFYCPELGAPLRMKINSEAEVFELTRKLFLKIAYLERPEGVLAVFEEPHWSLESLPVGNLYLIATGIEKPGNLGAMARTASAAGCAAMIVADENVDAFNPNAIRASTGAVFSLPILSLSSEQAIRFCQERRIQIAAAIVGAEKDYTQIDFTPPTAIVIGSEDKGLPEIWRSVGVGMSIPMAIGVVDSLNASTSAAILLFEAVKQQRTRKREGAK